MYAVTNRRLAGVLVACALAIYLVCAELAPAPDLSRETKAGRKSPGADFENPFAPLGREKRRAKVFDETGTPSARKVIGRDDHSRDLSGQVCTDYVGWKDLTDGWTCSDYGPYCMAEKSEVSNEYEDWYDSHDSYWDPAWGEISDYVDENGDSAHDACCVCDGGKHTTLETGTMTFSDIKAKIEAVPQNNVEMILNVDNHMAWKSTIIIKKNQHVVIVGVGDEPIMLDGGERFLFSRVEDGGLFHVEEGGTLGLRNVELVNGYASYSGGAIYSKGTISFLIDCTFRSNSAGDAGAPYISMARQAASAK